MPTETLRPNAAGDVTQLTPSGVANNWDCVDETPSDGDTTYVYQNTDDVNELYDLYNLPATAIPVGSTINSVTVTINSRSSNGTYRSTQRTKIKTHGVVYSGAQVQPPLTYTTYQTVYNTNPNTGVAWTLAEIDALQAGVGIICGSRDIFFYAGRCTQVWIDTDFTTPSGARKVLHNLVMDMEWG